MTSRWEVPPAAAHRVDENTLKAEAKSTELWTLALVDVWLFSFPILLFSIQIDIQKLFSSPSFATVSFVSFSFIRSLITKIHNSISN